MTSILCSAVGHKELVLQYDTKHFVDSNILDDF